MKGQRLTAHIVSLGFTVTVAGPLSWFVYAGARQVAWFEVYREDLAFRLGRVAGMDCIDLLTFGTELQETVK